MSTGPSGGELGPGAARSANEGPSTLARLLGYVSLAVKLALFALVFALAVKNSEPVTLRFFLGRELATSLALALVGAVCIGAVLGILAMLGYAFRLRRAAARARAEASASRAEADALRSEADALRAAAARVEAESVAAAEPGMERPNAHGL